ncbi:MAG: hypothetical protein SR3Q1_12110 [Quinella sp. 3Q1]|nr:hypothetical protein [Quinella sp. 3Q1]MBR3051279.1 hypothetical protein [Selenomonadaceae bacterium]MBR6888426.1 hypothetical protein [Selenomonadaceae bacterium]
MIEELVRLVVDTFNTSQCRRLADRSDLHYNILGDVDLAVTFKIILKTFGGTL